MHSASPHPATIAADGAEAIRAIFSEVVQETLRPPSTLSLSEWCDTYRYLSKEDSSEPGKWRTSRTPYAREALDCITDDRVSHVVLMWASQLGKTAGPILSTIGYYIDQAPSPILYIKPRVEDAKNDSKVRIAAMMRDTPVLRGKLADGRARDGTNTTQHKLFPGGHLLMVGANAPAGLAQWPIKIILADEVDRFPVSAKKEGDPLTIAERRTTTFWDRKIILCSSPTEEGASRIADAYEETDQRVWLVPCPYCGHEQTLEWEQVWWPKGPKGEHLTAHARYRCEHEDCKELWTEGERHDAIKAGRWEATQPFNGKAGFHLSALASPWVRLPELAREWIEAQGDDERLKAFTNTVLARLWREKGDAPELDAMLSRKERWDQKRMPEAVLFLTAGVDVQKDRIEARVWGWADDKQSWLIDVRIVMGDTSRQETWLEFDKLLLDLWTREDGAELSIMRLAIDSGYATDEVYTWARRHRASGRVMVIKGRRLQGGILGTPVAVDIKVNGQKLRRGIRLWTVDGYPAKAAFYGWLRLPHPEPGQEYPAGWVHLPDWLDDAEIKQLTSERLVDERIKGGFKRKVWSLIPGRRNEGLDCRVYAHAAAIQFGLDRMTASTSKTLRERQAAAPAPSAPASAEPVGPPSLTAAPVQAPKVGTSPVRATRPGGWLSNLGRRPGGWLGER